MQIVCDVFNLTDSEVILCTQRYGKSCDHYCFGTLTTHLWEFKVYPQIISMQELWFWHLKETTFF